MSEVRWLSAREQRVWRSYLHATWMLTEHVERQLQQEAGMPHTYYEILVVLSEAPNRSLRMSELAATCHASRSRLSHAVARLERAGWVQRHACEKDKRGSWASLTETGFAVLEKAAPGHVTTVRENLFDVLTEEQVDALGEICAAIRDGLAPTCEKAIAEEEARCAEAEASAGEPIEATPRG
ncbi:MAG: MarR family transcriptional regulator [Pseudonocardiaceae bacterium]|nr:MarR family transcriptional regulator [Pseudonocardiaceae bacterium]